MNTKTTATLMILPIFLLTGCSPKNASQIAREKRMQNSMQYNDGKFHNATKVPLMVPGSTWKYIKKSFFTSRVDPKPTFDLPVKPIDRKSWTEPGKGNLTFAWLGHSSILIALDGKTILADPVLEERASPFSWIGPKRFHPAPVKAEQLPPIDVVLITHDHYDHLEASTIKRLADKAKLFVAPLGIGALFEDWGVAPEKIVELDWWEQHNVGSLRITATPAVHYARRGFFDGDERLWCSWAVQGRHKNIFISGDSGYTHEFKNIGEKLGPFDVTFLKVGAYDELWEQVHMTPEEAVQQHQDLRGSILIPLHWATFDLALHPWYEPIERSLAAARKTDARFMAPVIGERVDINRPPEVNPWWRHLEKTTE